MRRALKAAALLALLAAATAPAAADRTYRTVESHTFDHETTARKRIELPVSASGGRVSLRLKAVVRGGEARFLVRDAKGRVRQDVRLRPDGARPRTYDAETTEAASGAGGWTVEVELKDATGSYELSWTAARAGGR